MASQERRTALVERRGKYRQGEVVDIPAKNAVKFTHSRLLEEEDLWSTGKFIVLLFYNKDRKLLLPVVLSQEEVAKILYTKGVVYIMKDCQRPTAKVVGFLGGAL